MDYKDAIAIFENNTKRSVVQIERCSVGIANYVLLSPLQTKSLFSDAVKMKMPIKILFIGLIGCLYVKYRYRLSCQRENTKTIPI